MIDDYFAVSQEPLQNFKGLDGPALGKALQQASSTRKVLKAKDVYLREGLPGSDHKDVLGALVFKAAGAHVDSSVESVEDGAVLVGSPPEKRLALSYVSLQASSYSHITEELAAALAGSWISVLMYRRCLMACLNSFFSLCRRSSEGPPGSFVRPLQRKQALELVLLACLSPLITSNIAVGFSPDVFCSDASNVCGAFCSASVGRPPSSALWLAADKKGQYTMLDCSAPYASGLSPVDSHELSDDDGPNPVALTPPRPLGLDYDFIEVFGGSGRVTKAASLLGLKVGPVLDLSLSRQFDAGALRIVEWLLYMLQQQRLRSLLLEPPCTSYSIAAHPALRSHAQPEGFDPSESRTKAANHLTFMCITLLNVCLKLGIPCLLENPRRSKMFWLRLMKAFLAKPGALAVWLALCAYGSEFLKEFQFVGCWVDAASLHRKCSCPPGHSHTPVQGANAKRSAIYCWGLSEALASRFAAAILTSSRDREQPQKPGLESLSANDVLLTAPWRTTKAWRWRSKKHINVLEAEAALAVLNSEALRGGDTRFCLILDSSVARGALAKGRSSARLLGPALRRSAALQVAAGLYPGFVYGPTRLNVSDDPSRAKMLRRSMGTSLFHLLDAEETWVLPCFQGLSSARAGWVRLSALLVEQTCRGTVFAYLQALRNFPEGCRFGLLDAVRTPPRSDCGTFLDFDCTLGYPGEGPALVFLFLCLSLEPCLAALGPRNAADARRAAARSPLGLPSGRLVLDKTSSNRGTLTAAFSQWLAEVVGCTLEELLAARPFEAEKVVECLVEYGRDLYSSGRPYWHYAETVNAITSAKPILRRQVQGAWDLAFAWQSEEPYNHHTAMPAVVLIALLSTCLLWGWTAEAGIFALAWGGLLRISEATQARRCDLVLPEDTLWTQDFVLLRINQPKTRLRGARHQAAKVEQSDLVETISLAFSGLHKAARLWNGSNQTLRRRLDVALSRLGVPSSRGPSRPLDLGSLRPGGATFILQLTEDSELVRRRGRWASAKVMEIYLQEITASTFLSDLPIQARETLVAAAGTFPDLLCQAVKWKAAFVPANAWYMLWSRS